MIAHAALIAMTTLILWVITRPLPAPLPPPTAAPKRPVDASDSAEWLLAPFQAVAALAGLSWLLVWLALFLAPLALIVLWVAR